jgi:hypothetical protein
MKLFYFIPLLFLSACTTTPKLALRPQQPPPSTENSTIRYPEVVRAYHFGRYVDPNDDLVMHEEHTVYRVEENTRWDLHPATAGNHSFFPPPSEPRDTAFSALPVNDAVLAEVNAQRLATVQIMTQARTLSAALAQFQTALQQAKTSLQETAVLRATVGDMKRRLDALESTSELQVQPMASPISTTNEPSDPLSP